MKVLAKSVSELTTKEYQQCYSLNMRRRGMMQGKLKHCHQRQDSYRLSDALMIFDNKNRLLAWALVHQFRYATTPPHVYFYVRKANRRQGLGTILDRFARIKYGDIYVHPWDPTSRAFFDKVGIVGNGNTRTKTTAS